MANKTQLARLKKNVNRWNEWKKKSFDETLDPNEANLRRADLRGADLSGTNLSGANLLWADLDGADLNGTNLKKVNLGGARLNKANLSGANLHEANLRGARLNKANLSKANLSGASLRNAFLSGANLREADLREADLRAVDLSHAILNKANLRQANLYKLNLSTAKLSEADLSGADLSGTDLSRANLNAASLRGANLSGANLSGANLSGADLSTANLVGTKLLGTNLTDCRIYGISAWDVKLESAIQKNLIITEVGEPALTVDDLEVAQFIYLMLNNQKLKNVIDTITSKAVLILGRFTAERKEVLDAIRDELRRRGYVPILFDFEPSASRDLTETVTLLARMARFIIADLTEPKSIPQELTSIIDGLPSVPIQPIILSSQREYAMYEHWTEYPWVLKIQKYKSVDDLLANIPGKVIGPAEKFLLKKKSKKQKSMLKRRKQ